MAVASPKLKLYTNHACPCKSPGALSHYRATFSHAYTHLLTPTFPGAHRAHIALSELNVPFEEEIIDLSVPRTAEYLEVNPRGLVPSLKYDGHVLTESAIVASFLADAFPAGGLVPPSTDPAGALTRARIAFFVDAYFSKGQGPFL
jgi:glutathione S-transferase